VSARTCTKSSTDVGPRVALQPCQPTVWLSLLHSDGLDDSCHRLLAVQLANQSPQLLHVGCQMWTPSSWPEKCLCIYLASWPTSMWGGPDSPSDPDDSSSCSCSWASRDLFFIIDFDIAVKTCMTTTAHHCPIYTANMDRNPPIKTHMRRVQSYASRENVANRQSPVDSASAIGTDVFHTQASQHIM
jgi:hypothetical protein